MKKNKFDIAIQIEKDHIHLNQQLGELKIAVLKEVSSEKFGSWRLEFIWQLRDFKSDLLKHFDREENGGFMKDVLKVEPFAEHKIRLLKAEHEQIIRNLDEILTVLNNMHEKDSQRLNKIKLELNDLVTTLYQHEIEENNLIQKAYYREYGDQT